VACPENSLLDSKILFKPVVTPYELELALVEGREWTGKYSADFRDLLNYNVDTNPETDGTDGETNGATNGKTNGKTSKGSQSSDGVVVPVSLEGMGNDDGDTEDEDDVYVSMIDGKVHNKKGRMFDNDKQKQDQHNDTSNTSNAKDEGETKTITNSSNNTNSGNDTGSGGVLTSLSTLSSSTVDRSSSVTLLPAKDASDYMLRMREYKGLERRLGLDPPTKAVEGMSGIAWDYHEDEKIKERNIQNQRKKKEEEEEERSTGLELEDVQIEEKKTTTIKTNANVHKKPSYDSEDDSEDEGNAMMKDPMSLSLFGNLSTSSDEDEDE
jgi:hypothetical protein